MTNTTTHETIFTTRSGTTYVLDTRESTIRRADGAPLTSTLRAVETCVEVGMVVGGFSFRARLACGGRLITSPISIVRQRASAA